jgi:hypothetical protein
VRASEAAQVAAFGSTPQCTTNVFCVNQEPPLQLCVETPLEGSGKSILQRCPRSLRLSASSTIRLVTPRATPTTTDGRWCSTVHQTARASDISASLYSPYVWRPNRSPCVCSSDAMSRQSMSNFVRSGQGHGAPNHLWRRTSQLGSRLVGGLVLKTLTDLFRDVEGGLYRGKPSELAAFRHYAYSSIRFRMWRSEQRFACTRLSRLCLRGSRPAFPQGSSPFRFLPRRLEIGA